MLSERPKLSKLIWQKKKSYDHHDHIFYFIFTAQAHNEESPLAAVAIVT